MAPENAGEIGTGSSLWDQGFGGLVGGNGERGWLVHRGELYIWGQGAGSKNSQMPGGALGKVCPWGWGQWLVFPSPGALLKTCTEVQNMYRSVYPYLI